MESRALRRQNAPVAFNAECAPLEQALAFAAAGPVDGRVVRELGVLEEASGGPDVLSGVQAVPGVQVADGGRSLRVSVSTLNGLPFGPLAVDSLASPSRVQAFTARRVV